VSDEAAAMSVSYDVIVPKGRWPSVAALDAAMRARGFPVVLAPQGEPDAPVREMKGTLGLPVLLDGKPVELEAMIATFRPRPDDETNEALQMIGADFRVERGDHLFGVALRSAVDEWVAASYVMATLVLDFDGYGYEMQSESHGREEWAEELIKAARQGFDSSDVDLAAISREAREMVRRDPAVAALAARRGGSGRENRYWLLALVVGVLGALAAVWLKHR
jgi:hypothetical protein